jgi:hypothetical protein
VTQVRTVIFSAIQEENQEDIIASVLPGRQQIWISKFVTVVQGGAGETHVSYIRITLFIFNIKKF